MNISLVSRALTVSKILYRAMTWYLNMAKPTLWPGIKASSSETLACSFGLACTRHAALGVL